MSEMNVLSPVEMQSRYEVELEHYSKVINIEALTTLGMARRQLIPAALEFLSSVSETAAARRLSAKRCPPRLRKRSSPPSPRMWMT